MWGKKFLEKPSTFTYKNSNKKNLNYLFKFLHNTFVYSQYSTVIGKDLWEAFEENIDETSSIKILPKSSNITAVMETWEKQAGLPMLIVTRKYSDQTVHFSQVCLSQK